MDLPETAKDLITIQDLLVLTRIADGTRWPSSSVQEKLQPIYLTLEIAHDCSRASATDDLSLSVNYGSVSARIQALFQNDVSWSSVEQLCGAVHAMCFQEFPDIQETTLHARRPDAILHAAHAAFKCRQSRTRNVGIHEEFCVSDLSISTIVGVNPAERVEAQPVVFDISVRRSVEAKEPFDFRALSRAIVQATSSSAFLTLEALASHAAQTALQLLNSASDTVFIAASKPSAIVGAQCAKVSITRRLADYGPAASEPSPLGSLGALLLTLDDATAHPVGLHLAAIAIGSNLGDRFANIEEALRLLEDAELLASLNDFEKPVLRIVDTSFLYETAPMYVTDQPDFINGACLIETDIPPRALLAILKTIEKNVGRVPSVRNGPRAIDLDILTYDAECIDTRTESERTGLDNLEGQLIIPHPRMLEREFVLRPLNDILPDWTHPFVHRPISESLRTLMSTQSPDGPVMYRVIPFPVSPLPLDSPDGGSSVSATATYWKYPVAPADMNVARPTGLKTYLMATLNATPDSFSDGSTNNTVPAALAYADAAVGAGADIVDVGGYSTRPGAPFVTPEEEIARVVPVIQALRQAMAPNEDAAATDARRRVLISVDTFRPDVARAAVQAGANVINDVYAFAGPGFPLAPEHARHFVEFRRVARELSVPVVLMHSRGDAGANKEYSAYDHAKDSGGAIVEAVKAELGERVEAAVRGPGGLRRWNVIVDPGVGFSKTLDGNLELLRRGAAITSDLTLRPFRGALGARAQRNPLVGFPQLIGASRKSFLGVILERPDAAGSTYAGRATAPKERGFATAGAVAAAVQQGALVVRVHDVLEMGDVVRIADALWR